MNVQTVHRPDLSERPHKLTTERIMPVAPQALYRAWTEDFGKWFAAADSIIMEPTINKPFFFQAMDQQKKRHPHYGRFLKLVPNERIEMTWVSGPGGTDGAETVVTIELLPHTQGTLLRLTHAGFATAKAKDHHAESWPMVLEQLQKHAEG
jgi:uncharacterized protein YndB with AHSA1/START domain